MSLGGPCQQLGLLEGVATERHAEPFRVCGDSCPRQESNLPTRFRNSISTYAQTCKGGRIGALTSAVGLFITSSLRDVSRPFARPPRDHRWTILFLRGDHSSGNWVRFAEHKERRAIVDPIAPVTKPRIVPFLVSELRLPPQERELLGREWWPSYAHAVIHRDGVFLFDNGAGGGNAEGGARCSR